MIRVLLMMLVLLALPLANAVGLEPAQEPAQENGDPAAAEKPEEIAEDQDAPDVVKLQQEVYWAPPGAGNDKWTWIKLKSGEWQRGEIRDLHDGTLVFDSDELDEFNYDWVNVRALISGRAHTVTTWEHDVHTGFIVSRSGEIRILDSEGGLIASVHPGDVSSMIQGNRRELNFWSGSIGLGSTIRTGNSDQTDATATLTLNRRAMTVRWDNYYSFNYATSGGEKTQETQRYTSDVDMYLTRHWFMTVTQYEFYRDPFQNIGQRHTPGAGLGYENKLRTFDWDAGVGLAWQYIEFVSVQADQEQIERGTVGSVSASFDWDITKDIELDADYKINFPLRAPSAYSSNAVLDLSIDVFRALELDFTLNWDRQNKPRESEDGSLPKKDDLRLTTGLSWEF